MKEQILQILNDTTLFNKKAKIEELELLLGKYPPSVEAMRAKLKKYNKLYKELTEENTALEKELDKIRRTVEMLPLEILQAAKKVIAYKPQER